MSVNKQGILFGSLLGVCIAAGFVFFIVAPQSARAAPGDANAMCTPVIQTCGCGRVPCDGGCCGGANMFTCPCFEEVNGGVISGKCMAQNKCEGMSFQSDVAGGKLLEQLMKAMQDLMKGGGGGGGGAGDFPTTTEATGCTTYYQVTVPSSDPCAIYNPSGVIDAAGGVGSSGIGDNLLDALGGSGSQAPTNVSDQLINAAKNAQTGTQTGTQTKTETKTTGDVKAASPGLSGDVRIGSAGATIFANLRQGLSEVAGFFGGSTGGASQALSAAGRLCASRPWSGSFIGNVIPSSFFDGLCEWRGYQPGLAVPTNTAKTATVVAAQNRATQQSELSLQPGASAVPPEVDIWAEPASVRLGTRTYIFWNARGVVSCKGSGPSFSQNTLSGGASTVPITAPTTFDIECLTSASTTVRDSVTVQIAI